MQAPCVRIGLALVAALTVGGLTWSQETSPPTGTRPPAGKTDTEEEPTDPADRGIQGTGELDRRIIRLSIGEAIRMALSHNLGLRVEQVNYEKSIKDIVIQRAAFDPIFATSYTMSKFRSPTVDFLSGVNVGGGGATGLTTVAVNPFSNQTFDFGLSGLLPTGTTYSITAIENRSDTPDSGFQGINPRHNTSVRTAFTQPLLKNFGLDANLADFRISEKNEYSADLGFVRLRDTIVGDVHTAYWNLVFAYKDLEVKERSLLQAQALLQINQHKVAVGSAKKIDIITAEAEIEAQKGGIIEAVNGLRRAQDDLLDVLNYAEILREQGRIDRRGPLYEDIEILPVTDLDFRPYPLDLGDSIRDALDSREDLQQFRNNVEIAELELLRRKNQYLPGLNLEGSWTQQGLEGNVGNSLDELGSGRYYDWSLGVSFEYPLGNRAEDGLLQKSKADMEIARLNLEDKENEVILEVTQLARDIDSRYQQVLTNRALARLRRELFAGEQQRLRVGTSTSYQVNEVQGDLLDAESLLIRAYVDYKLAITAFEVSVGKIADSADED